MKKVLFWIDNARHVALPQSILPTLLAITMASNNEGFSWWLSIIAFFGIAFAHLGMNLADDYFDYKESSTDRRNLTDKGMRVRIAKCQYLHDGSATLSELRNVIIIFLLIALALGSIVFAFRGIDVLYITLIAGFFGISYSGFPFKFSYWGLGELIIGIMFGPLLMLGIYLASSGEMDLNTLFVSIPVGFLVTNIVYVHSIIDKEADKEINKMTFARFLGSNTNMMVWLYICNLLPFILIIGGISLGYLHWAYIFCLLTLPMAISLVWSVKKFLNGQNIDCTPKKWMGPMPNWENYKKAGVDWFMIRWLLARNLVSFFCLILIIVNIIL